jgi:AcrR family transcriptional regulator
MKAPPVELTRDRPRGRPRSEPARRATLAATIELLGDVGFEALSMDAIAVRAGVSKATIYRWWHNKVELVVEAVDDVAGNVAPEPDTGSLEGDIRSVVADLLTAMRSPLGKVSEALAAAAQHSPDLRQALDQHFLAGRRDMMARMFRRAAARGELRDGVDSGLVADVLLALTFYRVGLQGPDADPSLVEGVVDVLTKGVHRRY